MTAEELCDLAIRENSPIDWKWISHLRRVYTTDKSRQRWARSAIKAVLCTDKVAPQTIGRAATKLRAYLDML